MRTLLDVNVVIALLDPDHAFHEHAHDWWLKNAKSGWGSCPIVENGVVRIMSNPAYSPKARFTPADLISRLEQFAAKTNHEFWPDDVSLRDAKIFTSKIKTGNNRKPINRERLKSKNHQQTERP